MTSVEVVIFCHNHERFIEQTIRSVFAQRTSAELSLRILDDASTDGSVAKIMRLIEVSPIKATLEVSKSNRYQFGSSFKYRFAVGGSADYVAFLDGDDYWISAEKIEHQIAAMAVSDDIALCHSKFVGINQSGVKVDFQPPLPFRAPIVAGHSLSQGNFIGTSTVLVRKSAMPDQLPQGFDTLRGVDDYPIWALITENHSIAYLEKSTTAYRIHNHNNFAGQPQSVKDRQLVMALAYIAASVSEPNRELWLKSVSSYLESRRLSIDRRKQIVRLCKRYSARARGS